MPNARPTAGSGPFEGSGERIKHRYLG